MAAPPPPTRGATVRTAAPEEQPEGSYEASAGAEEYESGEYDGEGEYEGEYEEAYEEGEEGYEEYEEEPAAGKVIVARRVEKEGKEKKKKLENEPPELWTSWWEGQWHGIWWEGNGWQKRRRQMIDTDEDVSDDEDEGQFCCDAPRDVWVTGADLTKVKAQFLNFEEEEMKEIEVAADVALEETAVGKQYDAKLTFGKVGTALLKKGVSKKDQSEVTLKVSATVLDDYYDESLCKAEVGLLGKLNGGARAFPVVREGLPFDGGYCVVFEPVRGEDLITWANKESIKEKLSEEVVRGVVQQIVEAAHALHGKGFMHRGLVPANILVDQQGKVTILDFLFHKPLQGDETLSEGWAVVPWCQPPEVAKRESYGRKGDLWTIGCLTYLLLTGTPPFFDRNRLKLAKKIRDGKHDGAPLPSELARDFVAKLLSPEVSQRASAEEAHAHAWLNSPASTSALQIHNNLSDCMESLY